MPSLNLDLDYFEHPKTKRLIGLLGNGSEVLPLRLWCYVGKHFPKTGRLIDHSAQEIESLIGWWGKKGECIASMVKVRFLEKTGDGYAVHQWLEHEGHLWGFKVRAEKAAKTRWEKVAGECLTNATSIHQASVKQCPNLPTDQTNQPTGPPASAEDAPHARDMDGRPLIPKALRVPAFEAAWERWRRYKGDRFNVLSEESQLLQCKEWGVQRAVTAVEFSIRQTYAGLCEPKGDTNGNGKRFKPSEKQDG